jgi:hypothetical protein
MKHHTVKIDPVKTAEFDYNAKDRGGPTVIVDGTRYFNVSHFEVFSSNTRTHGGNEVGVELAYWEE